MCNVLFLTCSSDTASGNLHRSAGDAIGVIGRLEKTSVLRERHLYGGTIPLFSETIATALETDPGHRTDTQRQAVACSAMLLREVRSSDILVIEAPLDDGALPRELLEWGLHVGLAEAHAKPEQWPDKTSRHKIAIVIVESLAAGTAGADNLAEVSQALEFLLSPLGVDEVALFEADIDGYPIRQALLTPIVSRSIALH